MATPNVVARWAAWCAAVMLAVAAAAAQEPAQPLEPFPEDEAMVRFVHLAPNAAEASVTLRSTADEGRTVTPEGLTTLRYMDATEYMPVPAGDYELSLAAAADGRTTTTVAAASPPAAASVPVRLMDGAIELDGPVPAGSVTFEIRNDGSVAHAFAIEGVYEDAEPLAPGDATTVTFDLEPGTYRAYCPVDDHAERGMELEFEIAARDDAAAQDDAAAAQGDIAFDVPARDQTVRFGANGYYTVAIIGLVLPPDPEADAGGGFLGWLRSLFTGEQAGDALAVRFEVIQDDPFSPPAADETRLRVVHAAPGTANLDLAVAGERGTLVRDLGFGAVSRSVGLAAGERILEVRPTGSRAVAIDLGDLDLSLGMVHTIFVTGTPLEEVPLEVLVISDMPLLPPALAPVDPLVPAQPADQPVQPDEPDEPADAEEEEEEEEPPAGGAGG